MREEGSEVGTSGIEKLHDRCQISPKLVMAGRVVKSPVDGSYVSCLQSQTDRVASAQECSSVCECAHVCECVQVVG